MAQRNMTDIDDGNDAIEKLINVTLSLDEDEFFNHQRPATTKGKFSSIIDEESDEEERVDLSVSEINNLEVEEAKEIIDNDDIFIPTIEAINTIFMRKSIDESVYPQVNEANNDEAQISDENNSKKDFNGSNVSSITGRSGNATITIDLDMMRRWNEHVKAKGKSEEQEVTNE